MSKEQLQMHLVRPHGVRFICKDDVSRQIMKSNKNSKWRPVVEGKRVLKGPGS